MYQFEYGLLNISKELYLLASAFSMYGAGISTKQKKKKIHLQTERQTLNSVHVIQRKCSAAIKCKSLL
jgi:hypothetical protein